MFDMGSAREELAAEAARLAAVPIGELPLQAWADLIEQTRALTNALAAVQSVAIARTVAFDERDLEDGTVEVVERPLGHVALDGPSVVAGRLGCTEQTAGTRVDEAIRIVCDLPEVHAAMAAGHVDAWQAKRICVELCEAPPEIRRAVSAAIAPWLGRESAPRLAERARKILGRIDAELIRIRAARAREGRGLFREFDEPGVEQWRMILPAEVAGPLWSSIDHAAQRRLADGEADTIGQARLDAFLAMATERLSGTIDVVLTVPAPVGPAVRSTGGESDAPGSSQDVGDWTTLPDANEARVLSPKQVAEVVAAELARIPDGQVEVGGLAPSATAVPARWLRDLLLDGAAAAHRTNAGTVPISASGAATAKPRVRIRLASCDPTTGALGTPLDDDRPLARDGYRPSERTIAFVKARDRRCRFPGCQVAARFCDVDHVRPWPSGPTDPANLICLCRRHHRIKQRRRWRVHIDGHGLTHWTDPTGVVRSTAPPDQIGATLPADLRSIHHSRGELTRRYDVECELERARAEAASLLEDALTHALIRETGVVPDHQIDLDPARRRARRQRLLDLSAPLCDPPDATPVPRIDRWTAAVAFDVSVA